VFTARYDLSKLIKIQDTRSLMFVPYILDVVEMTNNMQ
jgi:hypothetical protein